jgi:creatinine amidohydrolase/Fe(II)-dependent formamide hydrolase-like protein
MSDDPKAVHVSQTGENWEVESEAGTLAQAETKQEAIEAAHEAAREVQASEILVHTHDGMVEAQISVRSQPASADEEPARDREP